MNRQSILPLLILALLGLSYGSHQPMHADTGYTTASAAALYYSVPNATTTPVAYPNASTGQCPNAILNGGFETDSEWWTDPGGYIDYDTRYAFSGSRSMTVNASALAAGNMVGFWQRLTLPSNASVLTLDFESMIVTGNVDTNVLVRIADAHFTTILYSQPLTYSCNCDWEHFAPALDVSAFAGRTINLSFDVNANGAIDEVNFDDVQLGVCQSGPTATPLPLPQQVAPVGEIYTDLPSYSWQAMPGAVSYLLWLNEYGSPNVSGRINEQYTPAQANCATGDLCTVSPGVRIRASSAEWWITAYFNNGNIASESLGAAFTINLNVTATPTATPTDAAPTPTNTQLPPTATATPIVTPTPTATTIDVPTATVTLAVPPTATGTATPTATAIAPSTATPTVPPTTSTTPTGDGDPFEEDDSCANATLLTTNGVAQVHNFHDQADADWLRFAVTANTAYLIEGDVPGDSDADLELAIYDRCGAGATSTQNYAYSPEVRLAFTATATTDYFIRLENSTLSRFGADVKYQIAVREIVPRTSKGVLIVVAGRNQEGDFLQEQIHKVTNRVYRLWRNQGYPADRIRYLATDTNLDPDRDGKADVFALPDTNNLRTAITEWAASQLTPNQSLTLYIMDHGAYDKIYLDEPRQQRLTPADLHSWLNTLEAAVPGVRITVIIEACNSGSFIDPEQSISKPGRTILTSTGAHELAWATSEGARFSDSLLDGLAMGKNLLGAFYEAQAGIVNLQLSQTPWLDDDGDRIPNDADDGLLAAQLSFDNNGLGAAIQWQPWVVNAEIRNSTAIANTQLLTQDQSQPTNARGEIWAEVRDNDKVANVWAIVYPPSYVSPTTSEELAIGPPPITLQARGNDQFAGTYGEFDEVGTYRIWVYALDDEGLHSHTKEILFQNGSRVYLPAILR